MLNQANVTDIDGVLKTLKTDKEDTGEKLWVRDFNVIYVSSKIKFSNFCRRFENEN